MNQKLMKLAASRRPEKLRVGMPYWLKEEIQQHCAKNELDFSLMSCQLWLKFLNEAKKDLPVD